MAEGRGTSLTLADRLSHLTYAKACQMLGRHARELLREGGAWDVEPAQARLERERLCVSLPDAEVEIRLSHAHRSRLEVHCSACGPSCAHAGAALSLVLEEKTALGLAAPPPERRPAELLSESELVERALRERAARARTESMRVRAADPREPWTDYTVTNAASGKTYRVALRGLTRGASYCSCPDFRKSGLGTCKHILRVSERAKRRFSTARLRRYRRRRPSLHLSYEGPVSLRLALPDRKLPHEVHRLLEPLARGPITDLPDLMARLAQLEQQGEPMAIYPDAESYLEERLLRTRLERAMAEIRADPGAHRLRRTLLRTDLLPYQLDGIAFAVAAGRCILADEMGLGKTIQAIGVAELLRREAGIERVLVVCPASVKSQWQSEIARFIGHECQVVLGAPAERAAHYADPSFFTVCNYEQVLRDIGAIEPVHWDLIVLDEAQRIKNWEARTSQTIKALRSRFALALTGTPLENRLDDLYSIVEFIDDLRLGPAFRFFYQYRTVNEKGRVLGYRNLSELRAAIEPVVLRRTRELVLDQLPERTTQLVRIAPTEEQLDLHASHARIVSQIARKKFISEMDLLRLRKALLMCRLAANGTFLVDRAGPGTSSKLERLAELLDELAPAGERKLLIFSEWTRMLDRIEPLLDERKLAYVRLDGSVRQRERQALVRRFSSNPDCRVFLTTNAGAVGLNLQAADTVINVDLPWNPAVLEQRIARAHRMGQRRPVHVYALVTEDTIEENLLGGLHAKAELALAVLDPDAGIEAVDVESSMEELRGRLEILLGRRPPAPLDESRHAAKNADLERSPAPGSLARPSERIADSGGALVSAAVSLLSALLPEDGASKPEDARLARATERVQEHLRSCVSEDAEGRPTLSVRLPDRAALDQLGQVLARLIAPHTDR